MYFSLASKYLINGHAIANCAGSAYNLWRPPILPQTSHKEILSYYILLIPVHHLSFPLLSYLPYPPSSPLSFLLICSSLHSSLISFLPPFSYIEISSYHLLLIPVGIINIFVDILSLTVITSNLPEESSRVMSDPTYLFSIK